MALRLGSRRAPTKYPVTRRVVVTDNILLTAGIVNGLKHKEVSSVFAYFSDGSVVGVSKKGYCYWIENEGGRPHTRVIHPSNLRAYLEKEIKKKVDKGVTVDKIVGFHGKEILYIVRGRKPRKK